MLWKRVKELEQQLETVQRKLAECEPKKMKTCQPPFIKVITYQPNQPNSRSAVSFQLLYHDWLKLERSKEWKKVLKLLEKYQTQYIQMYRSDFQD